MRRSRAAGVVLAGLMATACGADRNPLALAPVSEISFCLTSLGVVNWPNPHPGTYYNYDYVYFDHLDTANTAVPYLYHLFSQYPVDFIATSYQRVFYMRESAGVHRLWLTNSSGGTVIDTTLTLGADRNTVTYFIDSLGTQYQILTVDESTPGPSNVVRLRVLNLSPDVGPIGLYVVGDTGQRIFSNLPRNVTYKTVTPYVTVSDSLVASDGNIYLKIFAGTDTASTVTAATVPFMPGRSYHLIVGGLATAHTLSFPGDTVSVPVNPSIGASVRATF